MSNFNFIEQYDPIFYQLGLAAEKSFVPDPNTTLYKIRKLGEALAQEICARTGIELDSRDTQDITLKKIQYRLTLNRDIIDAFYTIKNLGNKAVHESITSTHNDALKVLYLAWMLSGWFYKEFGGHTSKGFKQKKFIKPQDPSKNIRELEERIKTLEQAKINRNERLNVAQQLKQIETDKLNAERKRAEEMAAENKIWQELAQESEQRLEQAKQKFEQQLKQKSEQFSHQAPKDKKAFIEKISHSRLDLSEADTRLLIDKHLQQAGWQADTENLRYAKGARPEVGKNKAIAEWPTKTGPADYVLFIGLTAVAAIEAKKKNKNVYSDIDQAKRYAKGFLDKGVAQTPYETKEYKLPFVYSTNGRPYLKQLEQESGIWFLDIRQSTNQRKVEQGWFKPKEIENFLKQDKQKAEKELDEMDFNYGFTLRPYQIKAIKAVEQSIKKGDETALLAMATGTGKTKTCIALVYRLLKSKRFNRILFLVDRSALGEQAANSFKETRMENLNTFAETFGLMEIDEKTPETSTKVHIATVQGMVKRIIYPSDSQQRPSIGEYDCIVVDECHRGYLLDREMDETELSFRNQSDYISKYRSVIEYFDAYKVGLTATPALHTSEIFGKPVYSYSYTEAVVDGFLCDHKPPTRIITRLAKDGIRYEINEEVKTYNPNTNQIELFNTPDQLLFDVAQFNRTIINEDFNRTVIEYLIEKDCINPDQQAKTLVFCVTDNHADMVVQLFKQICTDYYGGIDDDAIQKITGKSDKPLEKIRYYKNSRLPNIAVTVDLLTTGIDVPAIANLVFLRRVNSRILFEQMLGRATRLCDDFDKAYFNIYDAVDIYDKLEATSNMKPVATNSNLTFVNLEKELVQKGEDDLIRLARDQFIAKLHSRKRGLIEKQKAQFEQIAGKPPEEFIKELKSMTVDAIADWFVNHPGLGELLDSRFATSKPIIYSDHQDEVVEVSHGYGSNRKPEDYLQAFEKFVKANSNRLPALKLVSTKPWQLTRKSLKELALELEKNEFRDLDIKAAWQEAKNVDIAARIIGFIRQAALGEALISWEQRVENALNVILARQKWTTPQKGWLKAIAKQTIATTIVDENALNQGILKDRFGGLNRANKLFDNQAIDLLNDFNKALW